MKMKRIGIIIGVCLVLVVGTTSLSLAQTDSYTKTNQDDERVLVLEEYSSENMTAENLTARANLTLPKELSMESEYNASYTTEGDVQNLTLTIGNDTWKDEMNVTGSPVENGTFYLDYNPGEYWANFTMNEAVSMNVSFSLDTYSLTYDEVMNLIGVMIPILLVLFIISGIIKMFGSVGSNF